MNLFAAQMWPRSSVGHPLIERWDRREDGRHLVLPKRWLAFTDSFITNKTPIYILISMEISDIMKQIRFYLQTIQRTTTLSQMMIH